jgi:hypothetical protein
VRDVELMVGDDLTSAPATSMRPERPAVAAAAAHGDERVASREVERGGEVVRPPGHHAARRHQTRATS